MNSFKFRFRLNFLEGGLLLFLLLYAGIWMWNYDLRMASLHGDDSPIFYAHAFKNPELFQNDISLWIPVSIIVPLRVLTSAMIWVPALLWRHLAIDPYIVTWFITLLQILVIGLAVYVFVHGVTRNRMVAVLAVIFACATTPWDWNPANFGAGRIFNVIPYSAYLAMPPVLIAFVFLLQKRYFLTLACLMVAGLIHPNVTLFAIAIVGLYWLAQTLKDPSVPRWPFLFGLALVTGVTVLPGLLFQVGIPYTPLPHEEVMAGIRVNQHAWPWHYQGRWVHTPETTLKWLVLAALSLRYRERFGKGVLRLALAAIGAALVFSIVHIVAAILEIPLLLYITGLRAWIWVVLICLPMVMMYWYRHLVAGSWVGAALSLTCLVIPLLNIQYGLFWFLIAGLAFRDAADGAFMFWRFPVHPGRPTAWRMAAIVALAAWWGVFLLLPVIKSSGPSFWTAFLLNGTWHVLGALPNGYTRLALGLLVGAATVTVVWVSRRERQESRELAVKPWAVRMAPVLLLGLYGLAFLAPEWRLAAKERRSYLPSLLDVQLWARNNTTPAAMFVVQAPGWRTMSLRRQLSPTTRESYIYVACREAKENRDRLLNFFGISEEEGRRLRGNPINDLELTRFYALNEDGYRRFNLEFGATHLVVPRNKISQLLDLPIIYENKHYVVYGLASIPSITKAK